MTLAEFNELFRQALEQAAKNAETRLSRAVPRDFTVHVYGAGYSGTTMSPEQASERLYLGPNRFYRIIDVAVTGVSGDRCTAFVRASGHQPSSFEDTWNEPPGSGPFKQLLAEKIDVQ